jgi:hypothetical protein
MKNLNSHFSIFFLGGDINEANLVRFLEDHLQRLMARNPGGKYDPQIAVFTALLKDYKDSIDLRNWNQAQQEAETLSVDEIIASFKSMVGARHFDITRKWEDGKPTYQKFYPHGLDEYYQATKGNVESMMNRWISACELHKDDLPEGFVTPFTDLQARFVSTRPAQLTFIANTDGSRLTVKQKKEAVALQATKHLHILGMDFAGQPEMASAYFDQSIIRRPVKTNGVEPEPEVLSDAVAPKSSVTILHGGFDANTMFRIVNSGSVSLKFYTTNLPDDPVPAVTLELAAGEEDEVMASELGADKNLFLMAYNASETTAGSYEVTILA